MNYIKIYMENNDTIKSNISEEDTEIILKGISENKTKLTLKDQKNSKNFFIFVKNIKFIEWGEQK